MTTTLFAVAVLAFVLLYAAFVPGMSYAQSPAPEETLNNNPVAVNDVYTFHYATEDEYYNTTFSIEPLLNDTDADGDNLTIVDIWFYPDSPSQDVTVLTNGTVISKGPSHFDYLINDGKGGEASAAVSIYGYLVPTPVPGTVEFNSHWHNVAGPGTPEPDDCLTWCFPVSGIAHESESGNVTGSWHEIHPRGALCDVRGPFQEMTTDGNTFELRGTSEGSCIWPEMGSPIIVEGECGVDSEISFTIGGQELRFIGDSACPPSEHLLKVDSVDLSGNPLNGVWTTIRTTDGTLVKSGFTPLTFAGSSGATYRVSVADYDGRIFQHWEDGSTTRSRTLTLASDTTLTASFDIGDSIRGFTSLTYTGTEEQPDLTVNATTPDGSRSLRMWTIIDPQSSDESGTTYKVYASNYKDRVFDHWEDGSTDRTRTVTLSADTTITAFYTTGTETIHMEDRTESYGVPIHPDSNHQIAAEWVKPSSVLVGKQIDSVTLMLQRIDFPTGTAHVAVFDVDKNVKHSFGFILAGAGAGSTYHSDIPTTMTEIEFTSDELYTIQADDRIGIRWGGGSGNLGSISVMMDKVTSDSLFDGTNTQRIRGTPTGWFSGDINEDLWMVLQTQG